MRIVLDTNVIISAFHFGGSVQEVVDTMLAGDDIWLISSFILWEVDYVLRDKFSWRATERKSLKNWIQHHSELVKPETQHIPNIIRNDPPDNNILAAASAGRADLIISGDTKHLLPLKHWQGIPILSPHDFLEKY